MMAENPGDHRVDYEEPRPQRGWKANLLLFLASLLIALILGDLLLRLVSTPAVPTLPHAIYHHTRPANSTNRWKSPREEFDQIVSFNSFALRGKEPDLSAPHQWFFLGDSMIEALQVPEEETLCAQMNRLLGDSHYVLNGGVGGYSPLLILLRLEEVLKIWPVASPEKILVGLFPNDLEEEYLYRSMAYKDKDGNIFASTPRVLRSRLGKIWTQVFEYSRIAQLVRKGFATEDREPVSSTRINPSKPSEKIVYPFRTQWTAPERTIWGEMFRSIGRLQQLCQSKGIELTLVIIPPGHQVSPDAWKTGKQVMGFPPDFLVESTSFQDEILNRARRIGVKTIDLLTDFRSHPSPKDLYFDFDGHWTTEGNRFAAEVIVRKLAEGENREATPE